ncbi:MAG: tyrosine-type recombinase/integrase [bacterium]
MIESPVFIYEEILKGKKTVLRETTFKKPNETVKFFYKEEIKTLIENTDNGFHKLLFLFIYETGSRISEALSVKYADIDETVLRVRIPILKQKRKIYKFIKISDRLLQLILSRRIKGFDKEDYLFARFKGKRHISRQAADEIFAKYVRCVLGDSYSDRAHLHSLRHSRAVHLLDSGMNIMLLKNFLGHSNITNTLIYLKYSSKDMDKAIDEANVDMFN